MTRQLTESEIEELALQLAVNKLGGPIPIELAEYVTGYEFRHEDSPQIIDAIRKRAREFLNLCATELLDQ